MKLTVVLPAYNEALDLPPLLHRIGAALAPFPYESIVLVVDDGSTDGTAEIARRAALHWPVEVLSHSRNLGLGAAIRTGLRWAAQKDGVIVTMDADNSHDPLLIPLMVERLGEGYDVVIASRFQKGGQEIGVPPFRKLLSHMAGAIMGTVFRYPNVRDYSCGYRAYRASTIRQLEKLCGSELVQENGFACMLELLLKLRAIGARATEVPLVLRYDLKSGSSKMRVFRTLRRYAAVVWNTCFFSSLINT